jgi:ATP-dependent DNA helicase UvrD/PcrA
MTTLHLRPQQRAVVDGWRSGYAAVAAVPGAGKTTTLSALATELIAGGAVRPGRGRQVLIVTYQNSGVANFQRAIGERLAERGLPRKGFHVRTLHGLATDVLQTVRHRALLDPDATVIDERDAEHLITQIVERGLERWRESLLGLVVESEDRRVREWPDRRVVLEVARKTIDLAKQEPLDLDRLRTRLAGDASWLPFALDVLAAYQDTLHLNGWQDFNDLIVRAVDALEASPELAERLGRRWPFVLEDEAQDSTTLQERMLLLIAGGAGNLLRAGDANQAILSSFTSSDPRGFRAWLDRGDVATYPLAGSSRSALPILDLANAFVERVRAQYPVVGVRDTALRSQPIEPLALDGIGENPTPYGRGVSVREFELADDEHREVVRRALDWLDRHPGDRVAILAGARDTGYLYAEQALASNFPDSRLIRLLGSKDGRSVELIERVLPLVDFLIQPVDGRKLGQWLERWSLDAEHDVIPARVKLLRATGNPNLEDVLFGRPGAQAELLGIDRQLTLAERASLGLLERVPAWLAQRMSPPADLLALIAAGLDLEDDDRVLANRLVVTIRDAEQDPALDRLLNLRRLLIELRERHRRLRGTSADDDIRINPGTLTISTLHQAKGLEWEVVFVVGCDDYWFPGSLDVWRPHLRPYLGPCDPVVAARAELRDLLAGRPLDHSPHALARAMDDDAHELVAERLRLLYVAITRARRALWLSWHRRSFREQRESPAFALLREIVGGSRD